MKWPAPCTLTASGVCLAFLLVFLVLVPKQASAGTYQSSPERQTATLRDFGPWLGPYRTKVTGKMLEDFGEQYLYAPLNANLSPPKTGEVRVVFLGDSITDRWDLTQFFPGKPYINRGIGGQVTPQLVVRFHADVVALKPAIVVILAGINDVQGVMQVESETEIEANYQALAEMAVANGIRPVFTQILPINNYTANAATVLSDRKPEVLARLNTWLAGYCLQHGYGLIDYGPSLRDDKGLLAARFTDDGIHPNAAAYAIMAPIAEQAIESSLR